LRKSSADDRIGLTLCYGEVDQSGVSDVFVGDVEAESIAGKNGRIQAGDQIIKVRVYNWLKFRLTYRCFTLKRKQDKKAQMQNTTPGQLKTTPLGTEITIIGNNVTRQEKALEWPFLLFNFSLI